MFPISVVFLFILITILAYLLKATTKHFGYFAERKIKFLKPYPLIGTNTWILLRKVIAEHVQEAYNKFKNEKVFGLFDFQTPVLILRDLDVIKQITIKDFDHFTDRRTFLNPKTSDVQANVLLLMKGKKWHEMRTSLSPIFTSSKMRLMFELISNCSQQVVNNLKTNLKKEPYDMKDFCTRCTCNVIASCAFGAQTDSFTEPDNDFYNLGQGLLALRSPKMLVKMLMWRFFPNISRILDLSLFDPKAGKRFYFMIIESMKQREKENIIRPDLIDLLVQLKKGELKSHDDKTDKGESSGTPAKRTWTDNELIAQCYTFFFAGFETVSTTMVFTAYELATNPDVQERLREEIDEVNERLEGKPVTYEAIQGMKYMDMVLSESLRKWPPAPVLDRLCTKNYKYKDDTGLQFQINEGDLIWMPVYALHRDPNYFPEPDKFDPERFSSENKHQINSYAYLPFGIGPRNCIGNRFALVEVKTLFYYLLLNFSLEVSDETVIPLKLRGAIIGMAPEKEVLLNLKPLQI